MAVRMESAYRCPRCDAPAIGLIALQINSGALEQLVLACANGHEFSIEPAREVSVRIEGSVTRSRLRAPGQ